MAMSYFFSLTRCRGAKKPSIDALLWGQARGGKLGDESTLLVQILSVVIATDVLAVDEDTGDSASARELLQGSLDITAIGNLVKFEGSEGHTESLKQLLHPGTVWAVRLGEDHHWILGNEFLGFLHD